MTAIVYDLLNQRMVDNRLRRLVLGDAVELGQRCSLRFFTAIRARQVRVIAELDTGAARLEFPLSFNLSLSFVQCGALVVPVAIEYASVHVPDLPIGDHHLRRGGRGPVRAVHLQIFQEPALVALLFAQA